MIRLLFALAALIVLTSPVAAQTTRACSGATSFQHVAATGPVEIVPGQPDMRTYSCGFVLAQKGNTLDFQYWSAQAGTNCAGDVTALSPVFSLPTDVVLVNRLENVGPYTKIGYSLCIQTFGAGGLSGIIYWMQF